MRWARAGIPYPILIRPGQQPRQIRSEGGLLGAFASQTFEMVSHKFEQGDTLLFFSDGIESLLLGKLNGNDDTSILPTAWIDKVAIDGPESALAEIHQLIAEKTPANWAKDDITVIAIKMN
jgi:serine phosphatase RsbU (regulator of sigma subunit)